MEGLNVHEVFQHYRLNPTEVEAVTYYLPRLIAGETHGAEKLIHDADVYDCEPKDLAARYTPVPQAESSGDRFFFTTCKRKKGRTTRCARKAGGGTWTVNTTTVVTHAGVDVGERKNLSFKKKGKSTGWVMEEYRLLPPPEAVVADEEKVFCKIHLSQHAPEEARRESAAYKRQGRAEPMPQPAPQPEHVGKRPAPGPGAAADPHPPQPMKKMRVAVPVSAPAASSFAAAAPVSLPAEPIPEAEDDMAWHSGSLAQWKNFSGRHKWRKLSRSKQETASNRIVNHRSRKSFSLMLKKKSWGLPVFTLHLKQSVRPKRRSTWRRFLL
ncbi:NAC domain-containing protein 20-like [Triticum urartu]|uniref:NAC domain-containing protein 20-like n=1 Tax=Triticum urartu TaxID=4572 RepID=UPI002043C514|nr:NAC domain-containing protein 20-like [Triticum urartu]